MESTAAMPKVVNPDTFEGQQPGAILLIKNKPRGTVYLKHCAIEVGDCIKLIQSNPKDPGIIKAKNLRTGAEGFIIWKSVFPVGVREVCNCFSDSGSSCRCIYVDFDKSDVSWLRLIFGF